MFSEFTRFFPQGLKLYNIQGSVQFESIPNFITCDLVGIFAVEPMEKVVHYVEI
jgi:hypothetical protein